MKKRKLFCEICPLFYKISLLKEYVLRDLKDLFSKEKLAKAHCDVLPVTIKGHRSPILRKLDGVDMTLQNNKAVNLRIAGEKINGITIQPGETFSFWRTVGKPTAKKGYLDGLVISKGNLGDGVGGGLCQLANLIHWLVLNSPLEVTELTHHTDALFPDSNRRVPFGTGTSIFYKNVDYRFKNTSDQPVQLVIFQDDGDLCGELRSTKKFNNTYKIVEEDSGYVKEDDEFFRVSKIYRQVLDSDRNVVSKELILDNHSKVMYDYSLIPENEIISGV